MLHEGYVLFRETPAFALRIGKRTQKWGKGYAFNPVAFFDRTKNPDDPQEALEGYWGVDADWIRSFPGSLLSTIAITPVLVPVTTEINSDFAADSGHHAALKVYLLYLDTDIDLIAAVGTHRKPRFAVDFARNLKTNLEIHGEWSLVSDSRRPHLTPEGILITEERRKNNWLLGLRWLVPTDTTLIAEWYHQGHGYREEEFSAFFRQSWAAWEAWQMTGDDLALLPFRQSARQGYGKPNPMREYAYFRAIQPEPFRWLYSTISATIMVDAEDGSAMFIPETVWTGITNLELRIRGYLFSGNSGSEYGEKVNRSRIEVRLRYSF